MPSNQPTGITVVASAFFSAITLKRTAAACIWRRASPYGFLFSFLLSLVLLLLLATPSISQEINQAGPRALDVDSVWNTSRPLLDNYSPRLDSEAGGSDEKNGKVTGQQQRQRKRKRSSIVGDYSSSLGLPREKSAQRFYNDSGHADADENKFTFSTSFIPGIASDSNSDSYFAGSRNADLASLSLVTGPAEDLCKSLCDCGSAPKNPFKRVSCDFEKNQKLSEIFANNYQVPPMTLSMHIKLARKTQFRLLHGFFNNNKVNNLIIEGSSREGEQVEIASEAFQDNFGSFPDIQINNVFSVIVRTKAFSASKAFDGKFTVRNCNDLIIYPDAFENANIYGQFVGINDLRIQEKAFNAAKAKLRIESSNIDNLYRFEASLHEIRFKNCSIDVINGGTFDVNNINTIVFENCRINVIKAKAITEKLLSKHISITNTILGSIESEAIAGSGIAELILKENKIDTIHENAIHAIALNATIAHNDIKHLGDNWLHIQQWSKISIENNTFGSFGRMIIDNTEHVELCSFSGNSITKPLPGSLNISNPLCRMHEISVNKPCSCNTLWMQDLTDRDLRSELYCTIDDKLRHCFKANTFNILKYLSEVCDDEREELNCVANMNLKKVNGKFFTSEELEGKAKSMNPLWLIIAAISVLSVVVTLIAIHCVKRYRNQHNTQVKGVDGHIHEFSQQDRTIINDALKFFKRECSKDVYKQINKSMQRLLKNNLPVEVCVKTCVELITQLVEQQNKIQKSNGELMQLNQLLVQHMQPQTPSAPLDSIYSEPGTVGGFCNSNSIIPIPTDIYRPTRGGGNGVVISVGGAPLTNGSLTIPAMGPAGNLQEPIYAEPNCAQQPLLRNEYASPADRNMDTNYMYTEPISNERNNFMY